MNVATHQIELFDTHFVYFWSSVSCFRDEIVSYKLPIRTSGKITTAPRLFFGPSLQNENKH